MNMDGKDGADLPGRVFWLDAALQETETVVAVWFKEQGIEDVS